MGETVGEEKTRWEEKGEEEEKENSGEEETVGTKGGRERAGLKGKSRFSSLQLPPELGYGQREIKSHNFFGHHLELDIWRAGVAPWDTWLAWIFPPTLPPAPGLRRPQEGQGAASELPRTVCPLFLHLLLPGAHLSYPWVPLTLNILCLNRETDVVFGTRPTGSPTSRNYGSSGFPTQGTSW